MFNLIAASSAATDNCEALPVYLDSRQHSVLHAIRPIVTKHFSTDCRNTRHSGSLCFHDYVTGGCCYTSGDKLLV